MTPHEQFRSLIRECGLSVSSAARLLKQDVGLVKCWAYGKAPMPNDALIRMRAYHKAAVRVFSKPIQALKTNNKPQPVIPDIYEHYICSHEVNGQTVSFHMQATSMQEAVKRFENATKSPKLINKATFKRPARLSTTLTACPCGQIFRAHNKDLKRGLGRYCSKSCSNIFQPRGGKPSPKAGEEC